VVEMSKEWDKAKKTLNVFINECNCMSSKDYKEAFASVAVGDWVIARLGAKLEIIRRVCPCLECMYFNPVDGCTDWRCHLVEDKIQLSVSFALEVLGK
jgi:hypothetical protein